MFVDVSKRLLTRSEFAECVREYVATRRTFQKRRGDPLGRARRRAPPNETEVSRTLLFAWQRFSAPRRAARCGVCALIRVLIRDFLRARSRATSSGAEGCRGTFGYGTHVSTSRRTL